jgi:hypothetical protein
VLVLVLVLVLALVFGVVFGVGFGFAFFALAAFPFNAKRGAVFTAPRFVTLFACFAVFAPAFPPTRLAYCNAPFTIT